MTAMPNILAIDLPGGIEAIVMLIMAVLVAAGNLLKKKSQKSGEGQDNGIILPPTGSSPDSPPQARPGAPSQSGVVRPQPMSGARARPVSTARQQVPQARPTPIAKQQLPQARPQPVTRQPDKITRPPPIQAPRPQRRPTPRAEPERQSHRVRAAEHSERLAARAEHSTSRLKESRLRKAGKLGLDEHAHGEQQPLASHSNPLHRLLKATGMKQTIILSEIIQPPLALRESDQSLF